MFAEALRRGEVDGVERADRLDGERSADAVEHRAVDVDNEAPHYSYMWPRRKSWPDRRSRTHCPPPSTRQHQFPALGTDSVVRGYHYPRLAAPASFKRSAQL
jgi:hypothetical protein